MIRKNDDKGDCDENYQRSIVCFSNAAPQEMMMTMMIMMIRMRIVMITITVASSASPMAPNATLQTNIRVRKR